MPAEQKQTPAAQDNDVYSDSSSDDEAPEAISKETVDKLQTDIVTAKNLATSTLKAKRRLQDELNTKQQTIKKQKITIKALEEDVIDAAELEANNAEEVEDVDNVVVVESRHTRLNFIKEMKKNIVKEGFNIVQLDELKQVTVKNTLKDAHLAKRMKKVRRSNSLQSAFTSSKMSGGIAIKHFNKVC